MQPPNPDIETSSPERFSDFLAFWTLYTREVRRFIKVHTQTVLAPVATTLLFLAVFTLAIGGESRAMGEVPFLEFLAPGLIMMAMAQNAFANTSSSIMIAKVQGNIVDTLMPPLTAGELTAAIALGGASRGVVVGLVVGLAMIPFVDMTIHHPLFIVYHAVMASLMLSLLGVIGGIWSDKFDHIAAVTNFVVMPLSFLSGTFYSIERLPESLHMLALFNPFFHMIDGFRYGFIDHADGSPVAGIIIMAMVNMALWTVCHNMFASGYKLKS